MTVNHKPRIFFGLRCPCGSEYVNVIESRHIAEAKVRRRRYECESCEGRFTTYEITADEYERVQVVKVGLAKVGVAITALNVIRAELGGANGTSMQREASAR